MNIILFYFLLRPQLSYVSNTLTNAYAYIFVNLLQSHLDLLHSSPSIGIILHFTFQVILVLLTVHTRVYLLAGEAVLRVTNLTVEEVNFIFVLTPAGAVHCLTVKTVWHL